MTQLTVYCPRCAKDFQTTDSISIICPNCFEGIYLDPFVTYKSHLYLVAQEKLSKRMEKSPMLNHSQKMEKLDTIFEECSTIADKKGRDYSGITDPMSNFRDFGTLGIIVRLGDKYHRAKNLIKSGEQHVKDESLHDTLKDIINYAALAIIMLDEEQPSKPGQ